MVSSEVMIHFSSPPLLDECEELTESSEKLDCSISERQGRKKE